MSIESDEDDAPAGANTALAVPRPPPRKVASHAPEVVQSVQNLQTTSTRKISSVREGDDAAVGLTKKLVVPRPLPRKVLSRAAEVQSPVKNTTPISGNYELLIALIFYDL